VIGTGTADSGGAMSGPPGERPEASPPADLRVLAELSAAVAAGDGMAIDMEVRRAAEACDPLEVEEALLQTHLFLGFPVALSAMDRWRALTGRPPVELDSLARTESVSDWTRRGESICRTVYGGKYDRLRHKVERLHPALDRWMITEGYGKVLGRPGLSLTRRELCIVAMLAAAGLEPQLHAHLHGALNAGASHADVELAVRVGLTFTADREWRERAERLWRRVKEAPTACS
jgi:4-carboxymuconolactone decarboxylase